MAVKEDRHSFLHDQSERHSLLQSPDYSEGHPLYQPSERSSLPIFQDRNSLLPASERNAILQRQSEPRVLPLDHNELHSDWSPPPVQNVSHDRNSILSDRNSIIFDESSSIFDESSSPGISNISNERPSMTGDRDSIIPTAISTPRDSKNNNRVSNIYISNERHSMTGDRDSIIPTTISAPKNNNRGSVILDHGRRSSLRSSFSGKGSILHQPSDERRSLLAPSGSDKEDSDNEETTPRERRVSFKGTDDLVKFQEPEIQRDNQKPSTSSSSSSRLDFDLEAQTPIVSKERATMKDKDIERRSVAPPRGSTSRLPQGRQSTGGPVLLRRGSMAQVRDRVREVPPEWALLLMGCFLGFSTGLAVVIFVRTEHLIHDFGWAGTPEEGAAWLREQKLADTWHRLMLVPVSGGIVVGVLHTLLSILDQVKASRPPDMRHGRVDLLSASVPAIKALQAAVTLGTGNSLGPEGPSVDIGKACAHGCSNLMKNNRERRIALVAGGAAAGIAAGFNAPVSGCFFAIETVLRPLHAENSPPLTTAMIILAAVISSTVSQVLNGEHSAFTVPQYELRSAVELPLYLILGMICGVVSVIFTRLVAFFTSMFEFIKDRVGIPNSVTPAMGGLGVGLMALAYPGVLYWGFTNVNEIMHVNVTSPSSGLLTQLVIAKVISTAFSKGSGLVGGVYAPSLFIGAALGSVYGSVMGRIINAAIPGHESVAHPQGYALVGMAAMLASVCSVPLTSVLLLFELTKDYHILLPLLGGVGLAFWVAAYAKQKQIIVGQFEGLEMQAASRRKVWRQKGDTDEVEIVTVEGYIAEDEVLDDLLMDGLKVSQAMVKKFVKVQAMATVKEAVAAMLKLQQHCAIVVDDNELLEGIMTLADLHKEVMRAAKATARGHVTVLDVDSMLVAAICTGQGSTLGEDSDLEICYPDMTLRMARQVLEAKKVNQLPVVTRAGTQWQDRGRKVVGLLYVDAIALTVRAEAKKRIAALKALQQPKDDDHDDVFGHGH